MIQSMTGYGKTVVAFEGKKINVEIKSLNSKQLDLSTRIAPLYREKEMEIRQLIAERIIRGKVEFSIWIEKDAVAEAAQVNKALMENYYQQLAGFAHEHQLSDTDWMSLLVRMPDVMTKTEVEMLNDAEWQVVFGCGIERPAQWEDLYDFSFEEVVMDSMFAKTDEAYYYIMEPHDKTVPPMLMRYAGGNTVEATYCHDAMMLRFALWMALSMMSASSSRLPFWSTSNSPLESLTKRTSELSAEVMNLLQYSMRL